MSLKDHPSPSCKCKECLAVWDFLKEKNALVINEEGEEVEDGD